MVLPFLRQIFSHIKDPVVQEWSFLLACLTVPPILAAGLSYLSLTNAPLPATKLSWINKVFACFVKFRSESAEEGYHIAKKNQFLKGQPDFDLMALFVIGITFVFQTVSIESSLESVDTRAEEYGWDDWRVQRETTMRVANMSAWLGIFALMWFLIPVARHSVLLVALGWSPVHALRFHIWAGHFSFLFILVHTLTILLVWFRDPVPIHQQFIPPASCWTWNTVPAEEEREKSELKWDCAWQWYNLTGLIAMTTFTGLWVSSLHWFRRRNYRVFYLLHVILGTLMLLTSILHYAFVIMYWLPSITYYLASTSPTLVQKVVQLQDAAGCFEVHVDTTNESTVALNKIPSQFVKLCIPKISVVWHPFTVFLHPEDPTTLRFLCRPVGPFTKQLAEHLTAPTRPVTLLDGFYAGANRCKEALLHDHVTIVAGGVAITPFLSMIPALIKEISCNAANSCYTRGISLHWACREHGLLSYVSTNYLSLFQKQARLVGIAFDITIYHTGAKKFPGQDCENGLDDTVGLDTSLKDESFSLFDNVCQGNSVSGFVGDDAINVDDGHWNAATDIRSDMDDGYQHKAGPSKPDGVPLELARMMPARFSNWYWNIPVLVAFNIPIWPAFIVVHKTYNLEDGGNFKELSATAFYAVVVVLMFGVFGFVVEGFVLYFRSHWPSERLDSFELVVESSLNLRVSITGLADEESKVELVKVLPGRPTAAQVLYGARTAEAPGIFLCGPEKLIHLVKRETNKENSWFGRTRYCLYDEPFEN
jgi:predicted ferric reductase